MLCHDLVDHRQSESCTFVFGCEERIEYLVEELGWYADSLILYLNENAAILLLCFQPDFAAIGHCVHRVQRQVHDHLCQLLFVTEQSGQIVRGVTTKRDPPSARVANQLNHRVEHTRNVYRPSFGFPWPREVEKVCKQPKQPRTFFADNRQSLAADLFRFTSGFEDLRCSINAGQRVTDLVRQAGR